MSKIHKGMNPSKVWEIFDQLDKEAVCCANNCGDPATYKEGGQHYCTMHFENKAGEDRER